MKTRFRIKRKIKIGTLPFRGPQKRGPKHGFGPWLGTDMDHGSECGDITSVLKEQLICGTAPTVATV